MKFLFVLVVLPALAWGQVLSRPSVPASGGSFTGPVTAPGVVSTGTIQTKGLVSTALATPVNATFTLGTGTLGTATYYYRVTALDAAGETLPSTETSLAITGPAGVNVVWGAVTGATSYKVYGRSTAAELLMATVTAPTTTWLDNGSVTPSGAMPALGTSGNISTVSGLTARDLTTTAASGAVAMSGVNGSRFCPGETTACITSNGNQLSTPTLIIPYVASQRIYGGVADSSTAIAHQIGNSVALSAEGSRSTVIYSDYFTTPRASIYSNGSLWLAPHAIGTCGDATNPEGKITIVPGATTVATKFCVCTYTPTGTVYAWVNLAANNAGTGIGDTTTCP